MGRKRIKVNLGDVFAIKVDENLFSYGQVVYTNGTTGYIVIYDVTAEKHPDIQEIVNKPIVFFANTILIHIISGKWELIGNAELPKCITFSRYIVRTLDGYRVKSHEGKTLGPATENDIKELKHQKTYSPAIIEDAVKAKFGDAEWYPTLDELVYKP